MDECILAGNETALLTEPSFSDFPDEEYTQEGDHDSLATESVSEPEFVGFILTDVPAAYYSHLIVHKNYPTIVGFRFGDASRPHLIMQEGSPSIILKVCSNGNIAMSMHADQTPRQQKEDPQNHSEHRQLMHLEVTEEMYKGDEEMELTPVSSASSHDSNTDSEGLFRDLQSLSPPESTTETSNSSPTSRDDLYTDVQGTCDQNQNIANEQCLGLTESNYLKGHTRHHLLGQPWIDKSAQQPELSARNEALVELNNSKEVNDIESNGSGCDTTEIEEDGQTPEGNRIAHSGHINRVRAIQEDYKKEFKNYYEPKLLRQGPYYSEIKDLKEEKADQCHFDRLLKESPDRLTAIELAQTEARNFYDGNLQMNLASTRRLFFEAFFVTKLLLKWNSPEHEFKDQYSELKSDLLVLDNQIPFFIAKKVHGWISAENNAARPIPDLEHLVLGCLLEQRENHRPPIAPVVTDKRGLLQALTMWKSCAGTVRAVKGQNREHRITIHEENSPAVPSVESNDAPDHFLGLFYKKYTENWKVAEGVVHTDGDGGRKPNCFDSAEVLKDWGVKFGVKDTNNLLDISFKGGKLEVPFMITNKRFITILANVVLYEKLKGGAKPVTSLALFLRCLINTKADVRILREARIMENEQCNDEELPRIISQVGSTAGFSEQEYQSHQLGCIFQDLDRFCSDKKNKWRHAIYREFCYTPVSIIKFIIGTIAFALIVFSGVLAGFHIRSKINH